MMLDVDLREEEKRMMIPGRQKSTAHHSPTWAERKRSFPRWEGDDGLAVDDSEDAFETYQFVRNKAPLSFKLTVIGAVFVLAIVAVWGQLLLKPPPSPTPRPTAAPVAPPTRGSIMYRPRGKNPRGDRRKPQGDTAP